MNVVFSDSRFDSNTESGSLHALISTMESLYPQANFIRSQDGLAVGDYEAELTVRSEEGASVTETFKIQVGNTFKELSMKKKDTV